MELNTKEASESRIYKDYRSKKMETEARHRGEVDRIDVACKISLALIEDPLWDDEPIIFDKVLSMLNQINSQGYFLGRLSEYEYPDTEEEEEQ